MRRLSLILLASVLVALISPRGDAGVDDGRLLRARQLRSASAPVPRIVNGTRVGGFYPTVGMVSRNGLLQCSGVLIGCQTFLTAGHCVFEPFVPAQYSVFLQHLGFTSVTGIARHPDFAFGERSDLAVLTLSSTVSAIAPSTINTVAEPPLGTLGDIVGFGSVGEIFGPGTSQFFAGIKRRGDVVTAACTEVPESSHICWDFAAPLGPPGTDSNTCKGDSGGPMFASVEGLGTAVVGTTSGGNPSCLPDERPFDADVHFDHEWIEIVAGSDHGPVSCGPIPPVLAPGSDSDVLYDQFSMDSTDAGVVYDFAVPAAKNGLRITTNGEIVPFQNYDLYVKRGGAPSVDPPDFDCASTHGGHSFEACVFSSPAPGQWFLLVSNPSSSDGEFDVTVSILGGPTPTPTATPTATATPTVTPTPTSTPTLGPCAPLDADGDDELLPLYDGVLVIRYLFGFSGDDLTSGAIGEEATRDAAEIATFLAGCPLALDVDGNGSAEPLTDGMLFLRYLFGHADDALVSGVVGEGCTRCDAESIAARLADVTSQ